MKQLFEQQVKIPDYALPYLINNDASGLDENDKKIIDRWLKDYENRAETMDGILDFSIDYDNESYFTWSPEFGLACNVMDCTILIFSKD